MPLQIASGFLRRIQDSFYAPAPREPRNPDTATIESHSLDPASIHQLDFESSPEIISPSVMPSDTDTRMIHTSEEYSSPQTSPSFENLGSRSVQETSARRRQNSIPMTSAPDLNAQSVLRKRILDIQELNLPEREKARRIQVRTRL